MRVRFGGTVVECGRLQLSGVAIAAITMFAFGYITITSLTSSHTSSLDDLQLATPINDVLRAREDARVFDTRAGEEEVEVKRPKQKILKKTKKKTKGSEVTSKSETEQIKMALGEESTLRKSRRLHVAKSLMFPNRPSDQHYSINVTLSDLTSLDRPLPDTRPPVCATNYEYDISVLSPVSIIIPFFNEAPTMLLRAIHSVLRRSPDSLIKEILLVDDMSYDDPLKKPLDDYIKLLPKVQLIRHTQRSGLIVARMIGARRATAPVIIFLDAHTEVNVGWLEPLLDELRRNPKQIIQPFIDGIDAKTLEFTSPGIYYKGAFSWDLRYTWLKIADYEQERSISTGQPFFSPTLVGCAIAMDKDYFMSMGAFDEGLRVWGGENLELAFRIWMCGGKITTVTCSRVGHVFKQSPNKFDGTVGTKEETVQRNLMRVADVWMDGMRKFFYGTTLPFDFKRLRLDRNELESLEKRKQLRASLTCRNFEWYLHNVIPEMEETPPMNSRYFGEIMNLHSRACWEITDDYYVGMTYFCFEHKVMPKNYFSLTTDGLLRYRDKCVTIQPPRPFLIIGECPPVSASGAELELFGVWEMLNRGIVWGSLKLRRINEKGEMVYWCIVQVTNAMPVHVKEQMPQLGPCDNNDPFQTWGFTYAVNFTMVPEYVLS